MNDNEFTKDLRGDIMRRLERAQDEYVFVKDDEYERHPDSADQRRIAAAWRYVDLYAKAYLEGLPLVTMSVCPFCRATFVHTFDPYDMDGVAWQATVPKQCEPMTCDHLCFFRGAVFLGDHRAPKGPRMGYAFPGPEVPYVIPRQLELSGMVAVIGELPMEPGWQAYSIVYYADPKPPADLLTSNWGERSYSYIDPRSGMAQCDYPNDPWDFELEPWVARGKLLWCVPGSGNMVLADPQIPCPYLHLPGRREALRVGRDGVVSVGVPDGTLIEPFE